MIGTTPKWCFSQDSEIKSLEIPKIRTPTTLDAHNFLWKPLIEASFQEKL
jgi:hypothetical protein